MGAQLKASLQRLVRKYSPVLREVRGEGLMLGLGLSNKQTDYLMPSLVAQVAEVSVSIYLTSCVYACMSACMCLVCALIIMRTPCYINQCALAHCDNLPNAHQLCLCTCNGDTMASSSKPATQDVCYWPTTHSRLLMGHCLCPPPWSLPLQQENLVPLLASYILANHNIRLAPTLSSGTTMRVEPPLTITSEECAALVDALDATLLHVQRGNTFELTRHWIGVPTRPYTPSLGAKVISTGIKGYLRSVHDSLVLPRSVLPPEGLVCVGQP